jgi:hypothetical protein
MAGQTSGRRAFKTDGMALVAGHGPMNSGQCETRRRIVVETAWLPGRLGMTCLAVTAEPCLGMDRFGRGIEVFQVT